MEPEHRGMGRLLRGGKRRLVAALLVFGTTAALLPVVVWLCLPRVELYPEGITWSRVVADRGGRLLNITRTADDQYRLFVPLAQVAAPLREATLAYEDRRFYEHGGVDWRAVLRAVRGLAGGRRAGGASTLTMQVARLRFGLKTKSLPGKFEQMLRAWQLEKYYTKEQILEAYLNLAPYGGNVQGIGAAAAIRCGKPAAALTRAESLVLSMLPQNPSKRRAEAGFPEDERTLRARRALLLQLISGSGWRSDPLLLTFRLPKPPRVPHEAPHFCRTLLASNPGQRLDSTLDRTWQRALERVAASARLSARGNVAMLLLHAPTREVLAYVGSSDFGDATRCGQVDGVRARRSPGSLVKPFLYARALDEGLICPDSLMGDVPAFFADWKPENYLRRFRGAVRVRDALRESLNLPAIALMDRVSPFYLYDLLADLGVPLLPRGSYGLTLALGSAEMTPAEIGILYAALASDGELRPLRMLRGLPGSRLEKKEPRSRGHDRHPEERWSAEARFLVLEMLQRQEDGCAWKTGTSQNWRDGWIAAVRGDYVLVVWTGNFAGGGRGRWVGGETALPIMRKAWESCRLPARPRDVPPGVRDVELCAVSGRLPNPACRNRIRGRYIAGVSSLRRCTMHAAPAVGNADPNDGPEAGQASAESWPVELAAWFERQAMPLRAVAPQSMPGRSGVRPEAPRILSPIGERTYLLVDAAGRPAQLALQAEAVPGTRLLYWFLDSDFLGSAPPGQVLSLTPREGNHTLWVIDDQGRRASCRLVFARP